MNEKLNSEIYASKYNGQLDLYAQMIEKELDTQVIKKLIYYVVQGEIVQIV